jgi:amino acid adenylation domain-containing protein
MLLHQVFQQTARRVPRRVALIADARRVSFEELDHESDALAAGLQRTGVLRGDRVATLLDNSIEAVVSMLAILKAGAVFMPISPLTKSEKLDFLLKDAGAVSLITQSNLHDVYSEAMAGSRRLRSCIVAGGPPSGRAGLAVDYGVTVAEGEAPAASGVIDADLAAIVYTSGTSGQAKGVMLTHANIVAATESICAYLPIVEDDVILCVLPVAFNYGLSQLLLCFATGCSVVLERSFAFPVQVLERMVHERATVFPAVPTVYAMLLGLKCLGDFDLNGLRILTNAGAALSEPHLLALRRLLPRARIYPMYGQTECVRITYLEPEEVDRRPGSVGRGMPNQEHWLVDENGKRLPPGSIGELVVRGSHLMRGYWQRPEETERKLRPGPVPGERVLHTGDLFRSDAEGYLYFIGRQDDIIKCRGEKVSPKEVESALYALEGVLEAAVVGVPDPVLGQAIKAFIALRPGHSYTEREIKRHCLSRLESFMVPQQVAFVAELPKTDNGKIRKAGLA